MAEPKTKKTTASVSAFIAKVADVERRADCKSLVRLMKKVTGEPAAMWGDAIVGFGTYSYVYSSGRKSDWPRVAFSPRKGDLTLYLLGRTPAFDALLAKLGKHKSAKACIYVKRLADVDLGVLEKLIAASNKEMKRRYP